MAKDTAVVRITSVLLWFVLAHAPLAELKAAPTGKPLRWQTLPALPAPISGQFAGVAGDNQGDGGVVLVAGGSDFPVAPPWDGGEKMWYDDVILLEPGGEAWKSVGKLPHPTAYGVSGSTAEGLVCVGGSDGKRHYSDAYILGWSGGELTRNALPDLPRPCAFMAGAVLKDVIYVTGGQDAPDAQTAMKTFWSLDLSRPENERSWEELEPWPGPARILAATVAQDGALFMVSGARLFPDATNNVSREYLTDAYRYTPKSGWTAIAPVPHPVVAAAATAVGNSHVLVFSGDDGSLAGRLPELRENHPGFRHEVLAYETVTNTWRELGALPETLVTTVAFRWRRRTPTGVLETVVVPGGEDRPGHRSPTVLETSTALEHSAFHALDYVALLLYLVVLVCMGLYFSRRGTTTEDFFLAGRRIPWWAAALSIFSTQLSAITFMAIPAKAFATDWISILMNLGIILVAPVVVFCFLPFLRRLNLVTIFEYLELRFSPGMRMYGSLSFIGYQLGRMGIVLLLPSLALATVTGFDIYLCIAVMGLLCTVYTVLGGIEAVVWTDVIQTFVLLGGGLVCLVVIAFGVEGGLGGVWDVAVEHNKFHVFDYEGGLNSTVFWVVIVGGFFTQLVPYVSDQALIQRFLTTPTETLAARAVWVHALIVIPSSLLFFGLGSALFVFFKSHPETMQATAQSHDIILPWFVATQLPVGLAGLVIAGLFAATMSSVDSSINSVATSLVTDFDRKLRPDVDDASRLRLARVLTIVVGVLATLSAVLVSRLDARSLWDLLLQFAGILGSSLTGIFLLGVFTQRANARGTAIGIVASIVALYIVQGMKPPLVHSYLYAAVGILTCVIVGYVASIVVGGTTRSLDGLTLKTLERGKEAT
jgi:SSS family solute:Na+ symporter